MVSRYSIECIQQFIGRLVTLFFILGKTFQDNLFHSRCIRINIGGEDRIFRELSG